MTAKVGTAILEIGADLGPLDKGLAEAERKAKTSGDKMGDGIADGAGKGVSKFEANLAKLSAVGVAGFAALGAASIKFAADYEHGIDQVGAVAQATDEQLKGLSQTGLRLGRDTAFGATEAAGAMEILAANGISATDIINGAADAAVNLAAAGGTTLAVAADVASTAMAVWNLETTEMTDVVNRLAGAANVSRFGVEDMGQAVAMAGGVAAQMGVSFADLTTAIAATASSFASGSDAGTSFKTFLLGLDGTTDKAKETIAQYGLEFRKANGELKPMAEIADELRVKIGSLGEAQQVAALKTIFGNDAYRTAAGLMSLTAGEFKELDTAMKNTDAADIAAQRMGNLKGDIEELKGSIESLAIATGQKVIPALAGMARGGAEVMEAFGELPSSTQNIVLLGAALVTAAPLMAKLGKAAISTAAAVRGVEGASMGAGMKLGLFAASVTAVVAIADYGLKQSTGHGLFTHLFGSPGEIDALAAASSRLEHATKWATEEQKLGIFAADLNRILSDQKEKFDEASIGVAMYAQNQTVGIDATGKMVGETKALFEAMSAAGVPLETMIGMADRLSPSLKETAYQAGDLNNAITAQGMALAEASASYAGALDDISPFVTEMAGATVVIDGLTPSIQAAQLSGDEFTAAMGGWGPVIEAVLGDLGAKGSVAFETLRGQIPPTITSVEGMSTYLSETFGPDTAKAFETMVGDVEASFEDLKGALATLFPSADEAFDKWQERVNQAALDQAAFKGNIIFLYDEMKKAGVAMPEAIAAAIGEQGPGATANFVKYFQEDPAGALETLGQFAPIVTGQTVDSIIQEYNGAEPGVSLALQTGIIDPVNAQMAAAQEAAWASARATSDGMGPSLAAGMDDITSTVDTYFGTPAVAAIGTAGANMKSGATTAGADAGEGLGIGLDSKVGRVIAAAANLGQSVLNTLAGYGQSPWPGMEEHGVDAVEGFILGMASKEGALYKQAAELATMALDVFAQAVKAEPPPPEPILNPYGREYGEITPNFSNSGIAINAGALRRRGWTQDASGKWLPPGSVTPTLALPPGAGGFVAPPPVTPKVGTYKSFSPMPSSLEATPMPTGVGAGGVNLTVNAEVLDPAKFSYQTKAFVDRYIEEQYSSEALAWGAT
ncbi:MAG: phage tail tape measure protein [Burkholderiaceae bacterium]